MYKVEFENQIIENSDLDELCRELANKSTFDRNIFYHIKIDNKYIAGAIWAITTYNREILIVEHIEDNTQSYYFKKESI